MNGYVNERMNNQYPYTYVQTYVHVVHIYVIYIEFINAQYYYMMILSR